MASPWRAYLAARYSRRDEMRGYAEQLADLGLATVEAAWLSGEHDWGGSTSTPEELAAAQRYALDDMRDLARAHLVLVFTEGPDPAGRNRGGRHVEYGLALAGHLSRPATKYVLVVGPAENVFHTLPQVPRVADWTGALAYLAQLRADMDSAAVRRRLQLQ